MPKTKAEPSTFVSPEALYTFYYLLAHAEPAEANEYEAKFSSSVALQPWLMKRFPKQWNTSLRWRTVKELEAAGWVKRKGPKSRTIYITVKPNLGCPARV